MANPMVFDDLYDGFIVTPTTDIDGLEKIQPTGFETETYDYCFIGISLTPMKVAELKAAMQTGSQFYVEIKFKNRNNGELVGDPKYVHQIFKYSKLENTDDPLELLMEGYLELPKKTPTLTVTSIKVLGAKIFYVDALPAD